MGKRLLSESIAEYTRRVGLIPAWPSPPEEHDQGEVGSGDTGEGRSH